MSLLDTRVLLEEKIKLVTKEAAKLYYDITVNGVENDEGKYKALTEKLGVLKMDLHMVNQLISDGIE